MLNITMSTEREKSEQNVSKTGVLVRLKTFISKLSTKRVLGMLY
jgi:hypothetical protein